MNTSFINENVFLLFIDMAFLELWNVEKIFVSLDTYDS